MARVPFTYTWIEQGKILAGSIPQQSEDLATLRGLGIKSILSLTRRDISTYTDMETYPFNHAKYPIPDNSIAADKTMLEAAEFIDHAVKRGEPVYVHCRGGIGRTGMILLAYYVLHRGMSLVEAKELVKVRRNYEGNASAIDQGSPQKEWIDTLEGRKNGT